MVPPIVRRNTYKSTDMRLWSICTPAIKTKSTRTRTFPFSAWSNPVDPRNAKYDQSKVRANPNYIYVVKKKTAATAPSAKLTDTPINEAAPVCSSWPTVLLPETT